MITPRWVAVPAQPIAIDDLLNYLVAALELTANDSRVYEIGGADQVSYGELMREYARQRSLRRLLIRVPVLTPRLSSLWLGLVTPLYARIGRKLIDSIRHPTLVRDPSALVDFRYPSGWLPAGNCGGTAERRPRVRGDPLVGRGFRQRRTGKLDGCPLRKSSHRFALRTLQSRHFKPSRRSDELVAIKDGTTPTACGSCVGCSISCSVGSGFAADVAVPIRFAPATQSTVGVSRPSSRTAAYVCSPRCDCQAELGSNSKSIRRRVDRRFGKRPSSIRLA